MAKISISLKNDSMKTERYFSGLINRIKILDLNRYGRMGVEALRNATPKDTGKTSESWDYRIVTSRDVSRIEWFNTNIQNGINIAVLIQYGHATRNGGFVEGVDYINPALRPVFEEIAESAWREVTEQ